MKMTVVRVAVALGMVSFSFAADDSLLSGFTGQYKGNLNFGGIGFGRTTGSVKASRTKENGAIKLRSQIAANGETGILTEKFSIRGKRLKYQFTLMGNGFVLQGSGSGRVKVFKKAIKMTGAADIGGSSYILNSAVTRDNKGGKLEVSTSLQGSGGALIFYNLEKK